MLYDQLIEINTACILEQMRRDEQQAEILQAECQLALNAFTYGVRDSQNVDMIEWSFSTVDPANSPSAFMIRVHLPAGCMTFGEFDKSEDDMKRIEIEVNSPEFNAETLAHMGSSESQVYRVQTSNPGAEDKYMEYIRRESPMRRRSPTPQEVQDTYQSILTIVESASSRFIEQKKSIATPRISS